MGAYLLGIGSRVFNVKPAYEQALSKSSIKYGYRVWEVLPCHQSARGLVHVYINIEMSTDELKRRIIRAIDREILGAERRNRAQRIYPAHKATIRRALYPACRI